MATPDLFLDSGPVRETSAPPDQQPEHEITENAPKDLQSSKDVVAPQGGKLQLCTRHTRQQEALKSTISVVATLVAAVTFAAAFTMPGGYKNDTGRDQGMAILARKKSFQAFLIFDTIAMCLSIIIAVVPIWSVFDNADHYARDALDMANEYMVWALFGMLLAFITGVYSVVSHCRWLAIFICVIGCSTFCAILALLRGGYISLTLVKWLYCFLGTKKLRRT